MRCTIGFGLAAGMLASAAVNAQGTAYVDVPVQGRENVRFAYADVLRANPTYEAVRRIEAREECGGEVVPPHERENRTPIGPISGGLAGARVRRAARASADEMASDGVDARARCRTVEVEVESDERRISGYDVEYRYKGDLYMSHMDYDPGNKLRVRVTVAPAD